MYMTQTQLPPLQKPQTSPYGGPQGSPNPSAYKPNASQASFYGQMPSTINAGAFKIRPREMDDGPDGGGNDSGYWGDKQQQQQHGNNNSQNPAPGGHANSYYSSPDPSPNLNSSTWAAPAW